MAIDYAAYVKESKALQGGEFNTNKFRIGKYRVKITRLVSRKTRSNADQIILEAVVQEVISGNENSCRVGEECVISEIRGKVPEYFARHMLNIASVISGVSREDLQGPDPEQDIEGAKAATKQLLELYTNLYPEDGSEAESLALGATVVVNVVAKAGKPDYPSVYINADFEELPF